MNDDDLKAELVSLNKRMEDVRAVHQGMFGIPGTEDNGLVGDLKDLVKLLREQNGRVRRNTVKIYTQYGLSAIIIGLLIRLLVGG